MQRLIACKFFDVSFLSIIHKKKVELLAIIDCILLPKALGKFLPQKSTVLFFWHMGLCMHIFM